MLRGPGSSETLAGALQLGAQEKQHQVVRLKGRCGKDAGWRAGAGSDQTAVASSPMSLISSRARPRPPNP